MSEIFAIASRKKVRFNTAKGALTVEDLWDLPLSSSSDKAVSLDAIAVSLHNQLLSTPSRVSFVNTTTTAGDDETQLKFDVVMYVLNVRKEEQDKRLIEAANKTKRQNILALIQQKENAALSEMSLDDLRKMVENL